MAFAVEVGFFGEHDAAVSLTDRLAGQAGCDGLVKGHAPDAVGDPHSTVEGDAHGIVSRESG